MRKVKTLILAMGLPIALSACAHSSGTEQSDRNQFVTEFYALVEDVNQVKFKSYVGPAIAIGAADGFLSNIHGNSDDMLGGAIVGGIFGGLITALFEGSTKGYEYQLEAIDGDRVTVIVEEKPALKGECVNVRVSGSVSISKQPMEFCQPQTEI